MIKKHLVKPLKKLFRTRRVNAPRVISRSSHCVSRNAISEAALKVLYRLKKSGCEAYLVGGCVRDLLLGRKPKDFDLATDATPTRVRKCFRNSRLIGRRFKLVHVFYPNEVIEVTTFRGSQDDDSEHHESGMILRDNSYGTIDEDVWRRDFTVNALYYNIKDFSIVDYTGGVEDLAKQVIRTIGDPKTRFQEDPVRMLRAVRLAAKLDFTIDPAIESLFPSMLPSLEQVAPARLFDEVIKLFFEGNAEKTFKRLQDYNVLHYLFSEAMSEEAHQSYPYTDELYAQAIAATDQRFHAGKSLNPGFLFSVLVWPLMQERFRHQPSRRRKQYPALSQAATEALDLQVRHCHLPRRILAMMRDVWLLQYHLKRRRGRRAFRTINHRYFRAAYDFLLLREKVGEPVTELAKWWTDFQKADNDRRKSMVACLEGKQATEETH